MNGAPLGVGVDVVSLARMRDVLETSGEPLVRRMFSDYERERAARYPDPTAYLATRFAAKEAVFKTLGIGWESGVEFAQVEIRDGEHGEPSAMLHGRFADVATERGVARILVSLSSDGDIATAIAIAVSDGDVRSTDAAPAQDEGPSGMEPLAPSRGSEQ